MSDRTPFPETRLLDVVAEVDGDKVIAELDVRHNASARVGDQYMVRWPDGAVTVLRIQSFKSAAGYSNTITRRIDAMREGVVGPPESLTARQAYQVKLAVLRVEGELLPDGTRRLGASRVPDVMVPVERVTEEVLERFATSPTGNLVLGNLRSGARILGRAARIGHNYAGERMVVLGMPAKGKSQLVRSLLSQAMAGD